MFLSASRRLVWMALGLFGLCVAVAPTQAQTSDFAYTRRADGVTLQIGPVTKTLTFYGPSIVRVNAHLGRNHWTQPSLSVVAAPTPIALDVQETGATLTVAAEALRIVVDKRTGALTFLRPDGSVLTRERADRPAEIKEVTISGAPTYEVTHTFTLADDESIYGLGQYNQPYYDYRGQEVLMVQTNIGLVVPVLLSTKRYGILWDIYSKMIFKDDAEGASLWAESAPGGVDYYLMAGGTMDDVIAGYRHLTGPAPMYPKAAFGLFMSKERYQTQARLLEVARTFRREQFPLDYIVQDWQYWGSDTDGTWSGMIWNPERYPDPAGMTQALHDSLNLKLMISIWPSVGNDTELARDLDAHGLRFEPLHWISKKARIYDAFSAQGRAIYFQHIKEGLLDVGVDALWMDGTEVEVGGACHSPIDVERDIKGLGVNAMGDFTRYLNPYTLVTTRGTYEGQRAVNDRRVFTLTRSAWAGQQRYAAAPWSGDTFASWATLRAQVAGGLNTAMAGLPYWTQDIGGFFVQQYSGGEQNPYYRELFARWHQFGIFNPIYRIHGTNIEREPYLFKTLDPDVYASLLDAAHLRYRLLPYIYSLAWQSTANGYTMMRGLPMDFPDDLRVRKLDDQFMFGPALLVHPVTRAMYFVENPPPTTIPTSALRTPDGAPGLAATFFEGMDLERAVGTSVDPVVDYTWPGPPLTSPPPGLTGFENFSGRWVGTVTAPETGSYECGVEGDDGFRLWLGDSLVINDWTFGAKRIKTAQVTLRAGQTVPVKLEYFQGGQDRVLRLGWHTPSALRDLAQREVTNVMTTYLPAGADWYDFWTNERVAGGTTVDKAVPLNILPLYVRAGSIVPMGPVVQYATEWSDAPYEIRVYPGADGHFTVYEDDNETYAYEQGAYATYDLTWDDDARTLTVGARQGTYPGLVASRLLKVVVVAPSEGAGLAETTAPSRTVIYTGARLTLRFNV